VPRTFRAERAGAPARQRPAVHRAKAHWILEHGRLRVRANPAAPPNARKLLKARTLNHSVNRAGLEPQPLLDSRSQGRCKNICFQLLRIASTRPSDSAMAIDRRELPKDAASSQQMLLTTAPRLARTETRACLPPAAVPDCPAVPVPSTGSFRRSLRLLRNTTR